MERRNFIKISALTGVVAALDSCGKPDHQLIRFVPEEDLVPGVAAWKPSVCTICESGCGMLVRVMQGEAEVLRKGQTGLIKMGLAKKLEGNPKHPLNLGKLCARGQAGLQVAYHPDRLRNPLKRSGMRGSGEFQEITWDDAIAQLGTHLSGLRSAGDAASLRFLARPLRGQRRELIEQFLKAFGAPPAVAYEPLDESVLRQANLLSFGRAALPTIDIARADYLISFGADFLGTWNSPVAQSIGYGEMRQGTPGRRGRFAQVEMRMSQTGANADEWIPCKPGMEGALALGIANVILREKLSPRGAQTHAGSLIAGWSEGLREYAPENIEKLTGVNASTVDRLARSLAQSGRGAAIIGGAPLAQTNGLFNALAVNALHSLVDTGQSEPPLLSFMPDPPFKSATPAATKVQGSFTTLNNLAQEVLKNDQHAPKVLLVYNANPAFSAPASVRMREVLGKIPTIVSFGSFIDETSVFADLILPDHAPIESWLDSTPESGARMMVANLAPPAVQPLHNTRAMPDVLLQVAQSLGGNMAAALPWKTFDAMLQASFVPLRKQPSGIEAEDDDEFWTKVQDQGGWWGAPAKSQSSNQPGRVTGQPTKAADPVFDGEANSFPFYFMPYASQAFGDGSVANLPWLQELPDVLTSAMWSSWVELNPKTAEQLKIIQGDIVEISSRLGSVRAPAIISPGIAPDMVAMPIGQGHDNFGQYASGRGTNPLSILAPLTEPETGSLAWAATRVKLARAGAPEQGKLIMFAGGMSRFPTEDEPR